MLPDVKSLPIFSGRHITWLFGGKEILQPLQNSNQQGPIQSLKGLIFPHFSCLKDIYLSYEYFGFYK